MRKSLLLSTAALTFLITASAAFADDSVEQVIVTATRVPTPEAQLASSVTVITADDIAAKAEKTLPDVLNDVPGLNIVQTGGPGGSTSVFMRGTNSNHVKVLVDGIDVSDPSNPNGSFDFGQFLTPDIERVEVLRGPQSGLYGSDAIGGVINIITKSGEGPLQFNAGVEGGSFDTFNQAGGFSGSSNGFHYTANIEHYYSGATPVTPLNLLAPGEKRNDDRYDNVTASTKLGYNVTDNFDLGLVARYTNSHLNFTGDDFILGPYPDPIQSHSNTLQYYTRETAHLVSFGGFLDETLGYAYSSISTTATTPFGPPNTYYAGDRQKLDWQGNLHFSGSEILVLGAEHGRDAIRLPLSASTTINSGYAELQSNLFENFYDTISVRYDDNDRFGSKVTYRVAPTYTITAIGTKLSTSVGTGFKAPTLSEMFQNFPSYGYYANPNLKPETSTGFDAGFEQPLFNDEARFGVTYFQNNIRNLIEDVATVATGTFPAGVSAGTPIFVESNIDKVRTDGIESFIEYQPVDSVKLRADYTYTEANDEVLDQELMRRPKHKVSLDARWQATPALSVDANFLYVGPWVDADREFFYTHLGGACHPAAPVNIQCPSGYTTVDVTANYDISDQFTIYGQVTNLFDEHYQDPTGFLRPARGFFTGIKAKI